mmetsp:Transcript_16357/g.24280  ORF Transcript_16357/g.24280 Transcript_16357/m.24280 type:complete len:271 (-) Transcript_16357:703-1515(-)
MLGPFIIIITTLLLLFLVVILLLSKQSTATLLLLLTNRQISQIHRNREGINIRQTNMTDLERSRNIGTMERSTKSHTLITIQMHTKIQIATQCLSHRLLHLWNTHGTTNHLNGIQLIQCHIGHFECSFNRLGGTLQQIMTNLFKLGTANVRLIIDIILQRINKHWNIRIGTKHMLHFIRLNHQLGHSPGEFPHILIGSLALLIPNHIEFICHKFHQSCIKTCSAEGSIPTTPQHFKRTNILLFGILGSLVGVTEVPHHTDLQCTRAHIVE